MINSFQRHDDYEDFARYLGVEYEDLVNFELGYPDEDDLYEYVEYEVPFSF